MKQAIQRLSESLEIVNCIARKIFDWILDPDTNESLEL
jgi:hypothetical protein